MKKIFYLTLVFIFFSCNFDFKELPESEFQGIFKGSIFCNVKIVTPPEKIEYIANQDNIFLSNGIIINKVFTDESVKVANLNEVKFNFNQKEFYSNSGTYSVQVESGKFKDFPCVDYFSIYFYENIFTKLFVNPLYCGGFISHYNNNIDKAFTNNYLTTEFYISRTETTFSQWKEVYDWAILNGYQFTNSGKPSDTDYYETAIEDSILSDEEMEYLSNLPVVDVNFWDVLVWLNAASQKDGFEPVFYNNSQVFNNSTAIENSKNVICDFSKNGYRLPTPYEFEFSCRGGLASYSDSLIDSEEDDGGKTCLDLNDIFNSNFYQFYAGTNDENELNLYAVYLENTDSYSILNAKALPVGSKKSNSCGLYDLSGNVREWCYALDENKSNTSDYSQIYYYTMGGSFFDSETECSINFKVPLNSLSKDIYTGFRIVKSK